jgi:excisionase family DNA binding protein
MPTPTGLHTRTTTTVVVEPVPEFESLKTAAARTEISVWTLREKIARGELRAYRFSDKPGSAIRLKRADVDSLFKPVIPDAIYADRAAQ